MQASAATLLWYTQDTSPQDYNFYDDWQYDIKSSQLVLIVRSVESSYHCFGVATILKGFGACIALNTPSIAFIDMSSPGGHVILNFCTIEAINIKYYLQKVYIDLSTLLVFRRAIIQPGIKVISLLSSLWNICQKVIQCKSSNY